MLADHFYVAACYRCCCCCRWYFDVKTSYYYGGEPVAWTQQPGIPSAAMFGVAPFEGGDAAAQAAAKAAAAAAASKAGGGAAASSKPAAAGAAADGQGVRVVKKVVQLPSHPLSGVGGHAMPVSGRIGGAKGVGIADPAAAAAADAQKVSAAAKFWSHQNAVPCAVLWMHSRLWHCVSR